MGLLTQETEQFAQQRLCGVGVLGVGGLVAGGQADGPLLAAGDLGIVGDVEIARLHALQVRARILREVVHLQAPTSTSVRTYTPARPPGQAGEAT